MRRVVFPHDLPVAAARPFPGEKAIGSTESITGKVQVVKEPLFRWRWRFDFFHLEGRHITDFEAFFEDMEDGANWCPVSRFFPATPTHEDMGLSSAPLSWSTGAGWSNGQLWTPSFPDAVTSGDAALSAREIVIDVTNWNDVIWRGFAIGFYPHHLGYYQIKHVSLSGSLATCRIAPQLDQAVPSGTKVTLNPTAAFALVPGASSRGERKRHLLVGASVTMEQVLGSNIYGSS